MNSIKNENTLKMNSIKKYYVTILFLVTTPNKLVVDELASTSAK